MLLDFWSSRDVLSIPVKIIVINFLYLQSNTCGGLLKHALPHAFAKSGRALLFVPGVRDIRAQGASGGKVFADCHSRMLIFLFAELHQCGMQRGPVLRLLPSYLASFVCPLLCICRACHHVLLKKRPLGRSAMKSVVGRMFASWPAVRLNWC